MVDSVISLQWPVSRIKRESRIPFGGANFRSGARFVPVANWRSAEAEEKRLEKTLAPASPREESEASIVEPPSQVLRTTAEGRARERASLRKAKSAREELVAVSRALGEEKEEAAKVRESEEDGGGGGGGGGEPAKKKKRGGGVRSIFSANSLTRLNLL